MQQMIKDNSHERLENVSRWIMGDPELPVDEVANDPLFYLVGAYQLKSIIDRYKNDLDVLDRSILQVPIARIKEHRLPVSLSWLSSELQSTLLSEPTLGKILVNDQHRLDFELIDLHEAIELTDQNLRDEIWNRFEGIFEKWAYFREHFDSTRQLPSDPSDVLEYLATNGGGPPGLSTCVFEVSTNNRGLSLHYSGWVILDPIAFGGPTSPVLSALPTGTYVFGATGHPYPTLTWDNTRVRCPGPTNIHLNL